MTVVTPESVRARQDRALLLPPVWPIRAIFRVFWPMAILGVIGFAAFQILDEAVIWIPSTMISASLLVFSWGLFIRILTVRSGVPARLPEHYADNSVPLRFQPEIGWQAIKLAMRTAALFAAVMTVSFVLMGLFEGWDDAVDSQFALWPYFTGAITVSALMTIPANALLLSRYGLEEYGQRQRDGGLPKHLVQRRNAAVDALLEDYPEASVREPALDGSGD